MLTLDQLQAKVASQKTALPALYGDVDFTIKPERFADEPVIEGQAPGKLDHLRPQILADASKVDKAKQPKYAAGQSCSNCQFYQGKASDAFAPCPMLAGKQVASKGWCNVYVKKA